MACKQQHSPSLCWLYKVDQFWKDMKIWLSIVESKAIPLKTIDIIFGMITSARKSINFCILHAKWYIHLNKQNDHHVNFANFLCYLRGVLVYWKINCCQPKMDSIFPSYFSKCHWPLVIMLQSPMLYIKKSYFIK